MRNYFYDCKHVNFMALNFGKPFNIFSKAGHKSESLQ